MANTRFALSHSWSFDSSWALALGTWVLSWCLSLGTVWEVALLLSAPDSSHDPHTEPSVLSSSPTKGHFAALFLHLNPEPCCYPAFASPLIPMHFHTADGKILLCVNTEPAGKTAKAKWGFLVLSRVKASGESGPDVKGLNACRDINAPPNNIQLSLDGHCCPEWPSCHLCPSPGE